MKRQIRIEGDVAYVPLTKGYEAVIDAVDVPLIEGRNWSAQPDCRADGSIRTIYAVRREVGPDGIKRAVRMHRIIAGTPHGFETDHHDSDGLNNRRANLRSATKAQNVANQRIRSDNTSGVKGVSWDKAAGKWSAIIMREGRSRFLGKFATVEAAAAAYAAASAELHGEFGRLA